MVRTHGFELRTQSTAVDFDDCAQVLRDYVPEVEELVRRTVVDNGAVDFLTTEYKFLAVFVIFIFTGVACMLIGAKGADGKTVYRIAGEEVGSDAA